MTTYQHYCRACGALLLIPDDEAEPMPMCDCDRGEIAALVAAVGYAAVRAELDTWAPDAAE